MYRNFSESSYMTETVKNLTISCKVKHLKKMMKKELEFKFLILIGEVIQISNILFNLYFSICHLFF